MTARKMEQYRVNLEAAGFGTLMGLFTYWLSLIPRIPPWITQTVVTLGMSAAAIILNFFLQRELRRRWPDDKLKRYLVRDSDFEAVKKLQAEMEEKRKRGDADE